jgi:ribosome-associated protein
MTQGAKELAEHIAKTLYDKKGEDIQIIDISNLSILADCFVVASGSNPLQVRALCDDVKQALAARGEHNVRVDGYDAGRWVVLDATDVLVHIFHEEERAFYNLERLWSDGTNTTVYNG